MPTARKTAILTGGALVLGISAGLFTQPTPEVQFIEVPVYETRVVEKEVPVPSDETVTVTTPLPESCLRAMEILPDITADTDVQNNAAGEILLALEALGTGVVEPNIHEINKATSILRKQKDRLGTATIHSKQALIDFTNTLDECEEDLGE
jgi:hypothetical protein